MPSASHVLNTVSWVTFFVGLMTITVAYLSATFAGKTTVLAPPGLKTATTIGTFLMYMALLMMPAVPLLYHHQKQDLNYYDYGAAGTQWLSYILLPFALYMWDQPDKAKYGAGLLGVSLVSLITSIFLVQKAKSKRQSSNSPATLPSLY